jgi:hypothetical protein
MGHRTIMGHGSCVMCQCVIRSYGHGVFIRCHIIRSCVMWSCGHVMVINMRSHVRTMYHVSWSVSRGVNVSLCMPRMCVMCHDSHFVPAAVMCRVMSYVIFHVVYVTHMRSCDNLLSCVMCPVYYFVSCVVSCVMCNFRFHTMSYVVGHVSCVICQVMCHVSCDYVMWLIWRSTCQLRVMHHVMINMLCVILYVICPYMSCVMCLSCRVMCYMSCHAAYVSGHV